MLRRHVVHLFRLAILMERIRARHLETENSKHKNPYSTLSSSNWSTHQFSCSSAPSQAFTTSSTMAPLSESSSMENHSSNAQTLVSNTTSLSPSILQNPFLRQPINPNLIITYPNLILRDLHRSFASKAQNFLKPIFILASKNPFLEKIISFSSHLSHHLTHQMQSREVYCSRNNGVNSLSSHNFAAVLPGDSVAGIVVANGIMNFLNLYNTLLVVRLVLTWFPNSPPAIVSPLSTLCDPYLNIFRGIIPPLGGTLDLSPILAFLVLNAFTSTAAALPAELPGKADSKRGHPYHSSFNSFTTSQKKWMRRLCGNKSKSSASTDN